ncbi:DUF1501 domain-containing protein [Parachitinimonas caeni]|uniref:DUF1501 domain-containing protein n=1 Tax=Parachitinimonas caeni TaxID=3031301 RepID=A0ABT7DYG3_9NEIS|nr:DUF1501 domain-containing protein [Parachitinimonas caeni]MDK2125081.1 DUF1501 domain-containing protein [Parachitinimonas caeni]
MKRSLLEASINRRQLLKWASGASLGGSSLTAALGGLSALGTSSALAAGPDSSYRALVCVYLLGGNDAFNMLVPSDAAGYNQYQQARVRLAVPQAGLLPIRPRSTDGRSFGFHSSMTEMQNLFGLGRLAVVANVGTLLAPTSKAEYESGHNLPPQLFSHSDQSDQWMMGRPEGLDLQGWGGRLGDLLQAQNQANGLSINISLDGDNVFQTGGAVVPYSLDVNGVQQFNRLNEPHEAGRIAAFQAMLDEGLASSNLLERQSAEATRLSRSLSELMRNSLAQAGGFTASFPDTPLGNQLKMVANLISVRSRLGAKRQIFFVSMGGFDTHDQQPEVQPRLFSEVSQALYAFYRATVELGVAESVTTFTQSEFGRTLTNNDNGTDHGWGSHHMVMGGAVQGGDIYGRMPQLSIGGPDDTSDGHVIPTTSTYQYAATLGQWLGASAADVATLFPNLSRFDRPNLGFLSP